MIVWASCFSAAALNIPVSNLERRKPYQKIAWVADPLCEVFKHGQSFFIAFTVIKTLSPRLVQFESVRKVAYMLSVSRNRLFPFSHS